MSKRDDILYFKREFPDTSPQEIQFFEDYLEHGDIPRAWASAGYSATTVQAGRSKIRKNWKLLEKMISNKIGEHAPLALSVLVELMTQAKSETVRLNAAKDLLSRAGTDATKRVETQEKPLDKDQLDEEIAALLRDTNQQLG